VVVLDETGQHGIGECWPNYENLILESTKLRIGTCVIVDGLINARTKHLNGQTGFISKHPRQNHPNFINKPARPDKPQLIVCVAFHDVSLKERSALLEPRFLMEWQEESLRVVQSLTETAALLSDATHHGTM